MFLKLIEIYVSVLFLINLMEQAANIIPSFFLNFVRKSLLELF